MNYQEIQWQEDFIPNTQSGLQIIHPIYREPGFTFNLVGVDFNGDPGDSLTEFSIDNFVAVFINRAINLCAVVFDSEGRRFVKFSDITQDPPKLIFQRISSTNIKFDSDIQ